jgi:N-acetylglucosaminyl-diphospho-decaprenol L-rhamnosyltransferase
VAEPDRPLPSLQIVIVTAAGGRELVRACLRSLEQHPLTRGPMRVHLVDNASGDGTAEMVLSEFPDVDLREMGWNSGFCIANNVVLREAEAPYVLLLNPDTEVRAGALDYMYDLMEARRDIGVAGCRLVLEDGSFDHAAKRSFPSPGDALAYFAGRGSAYTTPDMDEHGSGEVDAVNGAFMFVRRAAMDEVGLLDQAYWLYMEDLDWCYRFHRAGWKVWYDGGTTILHVKGGVSKIKRHRGLRANVAFHRGMGRFYRKFQAGRQPVLDGAVYAGIGAKLLVSATRSAVARRSIT